MSISLFISGVTGKLGKVVAEELENTESIFLACLLYTSDAADDL